MAESDGRLSGRIVSIQLTARKWCGMYSLENDGIDS